MKSAIALGLSLVLAVSLAACGNTPGGGPSAAPLPSLPAGEAPEPKPVTPDMPWVCHIPFDDYAVDGVIVDRYGNEILRGTHLKILYDLLTGRPMAITQWRSPDPQFDLAPPDYDHGIGYAGERESALYSLSGELLQGWRRCVYQQGFGGYVLRADRLLYIGDAYRPQNFQSALVDMYTGEAVLEAAYSLEAFANGLMAVSDGAAVLGVIDAALTRVAGFPMRRGYRSIVEWGERYLAVESLGEDPQSGITHCVLNADFSELRVFHSAQGASLEGMGGGCLLRRTVPGGPPAQDGAVLCELLDADTGDVVLNLSAMGFGHALYYDGELMVVPVAGKARDRWPPALATASGTVIAGGFDELHPLLPASVGAANFFVGVRDETVVLISREGEILRQSAPGVHVSGVYVDIIYHGPGEPVPQLAEHRLFVTGYSVASGAYVTYTALYDMELNEIIPRGAYESLYAVNSLYGGGTRRPPRFLAGLHSRAGSDGTELYDILDTDGEIILKGLDRVVGLSDIGGDHILAVDGGFAGLMSLDGEWLWKVPAG